MTTHPRGFTLIEMLIATVLAAVLIGAELTVFARIGKDRQLLAEHSVATPPPGLVGLLRWDLSQASSVDSSQQEKLTFVGHCSIDRATLTPDQRWVKVTYDVINSQLWRTQEYLDDAARPMRWQECIASGVSGLSVQPFASRQRLIVTTIKGDAQTIELGQ